MGVSTTRLCTVNFVKDYTVYGVLNRTIQQFLEKLTRLKFARVLNCWGITVCHNQSQVANNFLSLDCTCWSWE